MIQPPPIEQPCRSDSQVKICLWLMKAKTLNFATTSCHTLQDNWAIATNLLQRKIIRGNILYYRNDNFSVANNYTLLQWFTIVVLFSIFVAIGNELSPQKYYYCKKNMFYRHKFNFCGNLHSTWYFHYFLLPWSTNTLQ